MPKERKKALQLLPGQVDGVVPDRAAELGEDKNLSVALVVGRAKLCLVYVDIEEVAGVVHSGL